VPSFHESLSLLALEAWAVGRPTLLNGASPALMGQGKRSGGAIIYHGASELALGATALLEDVARANQFGEAGRRFVEREYQWDAVHARLRSLIDAAARRTR
jgi:glycosyltransferase involved in cell wall biosynthesis